MPAHSDGKRHVDALNWQCFQGVHCSGMTVESEDICSEIEDSDRHVKSDMTDWNYCGGTGKDSESSEKHIDCIGWGLAKLTAGGIVRSGAEHMIDFG